MEICHYVGDYSPNSRFFMFFLFPLLGLNVHRVLVM